VLKTAGWAGASAAGTGGGDYNTAPLCISCWLSLSVVDELIDVIKA
jgi:hypothetical protein